LFSTLLARVSATILFLAGLAFLFVPDTILPLLIPAYPSDGLWLGQLLAATWLGLAALNWLSRASLLGGIYGRPIVAANAVTFFVAATSLLKATTGYQRPVAYWAVVVPVTFLAAAYGWLLFRGPLARDFSLHSQALRPPAQ
jgi:hypothetical protein